MNSFQRAIANLFKIPVPTEKPGRGYGIRKYAGASQSQTSLTDWQSWMTSADNEISSSLRLLISRSRQLYQDDSNVQTAIDELVGTVVGEGINLQSKVKNPKGELNIKVNQEIEDKFNTWAQNREWCDVAGRLTFWQMQAVIQHSVLVDGGILVRVVNKRFGRSPLPFALELIEIDQLDDRLQFWRTANGNEIRMGVEVDQWKRTAAYWILDSHPGDYYRTGLGSLQSRRVPASEILHIFNRQGWRPGQTRGVPQIHAGIIKARHLLGLEESEIVRSRVQSCISAFIENEMPDFEPDVDEYGNAVKDLYPGAIEYLQPGQKLAPFDPSSPNPNLGDFVKHFQRSIAGIFGLSSHTVTRDLSDANYSSLREGKLNEWKSVSLYRDQLSEDFNSPVFRRWLDFAVMSGFVKMPKNYESEKESKYYRDYWFGSPMAWVDPAKEMIAKEKEIALGLTTRSRVLAEVGIDFEEILQEKEKEKRLMEQYNVSFGEDDLNPPADGKQPDDGEPAPLVEGMQAVRDTAIAAIRAVTDIQTRTVETVPVQAVPVVERATEPEEEEPVEININMADYLPEPEPTDVGGVYPLLPGMTRAVSVDGERKLKKKKKKNCSNGQVCGFSCISKTKTCVANMTTAQFMEHNRAKRIAAAEKRKAAKGGAGERFPEQLQDVNTGIKEVENTLRTQKDRETAIAYSADGRKIVEVDGDQFSLTFEDSQVPLLKDAVLTHNHPDGWQFPEGHPRHKGNSFSEADIVLASMGDVAEVRAIAVGYRYSMTRPPNGWPDKSLIQEIVKEEKRLDIDNKRALFQSGKITIDEADSDHWHNVMTGMANLIGAQYTREEL